MSLEFFEGWSIYAERASDYENVATSSGAYARTGGVGLSLSAANGSTSFYYQRFTKDSIAQPTLIFGTAARTHSGAGSVFSSKRAFFWFYDGATPQIGVNVNVDGTLEVCRGDGTALGTTAVPAFENDMWSFIEFKATIDNAAGSYELRVNGVTQLTAEGVDTQNSATPGANSIRIGNSGAGFAYAGTSTIYIDDTYLFNGQGDVNNDFCGPVSVHTIMPTANGTHQEWETVVGASAWQAVDETGGGNPSASDYIKTIVPGRRSTFSLADIPVPPGPILGINARTLQWKDDALVHTGAGIILEGGLITQGDPLALGSAIAATDDFYEKNPRTNALWTESQVNSLEAGVIFIS